jgi:predicted ester cyclase
VPRVSDLPSLDPEFAQAFYDRWLDAWNQDDHDRVLEIVTDDFVLSSPTTRLTGMRVDSGTAIRDYVAYIRGAYPDLHFTQLGSPLFSHQESIVGYLWHGTGTFTGTLTPPGISGTGQAFDFTGTEVFTFRGYRACHMFASYDLLRMMRQMNVIQGSWAPSEPQPV